MAGDHDRHLKVMGIACHEASALGHDYICTEHVLLALLGAPDDAASRVLLNLGVSPDRIRMEISDRVTKGTDTTPREQLPMTPWLQTALKHALTEAQDLGHDRMNSAHLLLGLLRTRQGLASRVLRELAVDIEAARREAAAESPRVRQEVRADMTLDAPFLTRLGIIPTRLAQFLGAERAALLTQELLEAFLTRETSPDGPGTGVRVTVRPGEDGVFRLTLAGDRARVEALERSLFRVVGIAFDG